MRGVLQSVWTLKKEVVITAIWNDFNCLPVMLPVIVGPVVLMGVI